MELKYAEKTKSKDKHGWVLDFNFLISVRDSVEEEGYGQMDLEDIEAVLLSANKEAYLLKQI